MCVCVLGKGGGAWQHITAGLTQHLPCLPITSSLPTIQSQARLLNALHGGLILITVVKGWKWGGAGCHHIDWTCWNCCYGGFTNRRPRRETYGDTEGRGHEPASSRGRGEGAGLEPTRWTCTWRGRRSCRMSPSKHAADLPARASVCINHASSRNSSGRVLSCFYHQDRPSKFSSTRPCTL